MPSPGEAYDDAQRNADHVADRFPADIGPWTPIPNGLYEHRERLGLSGIDCAVIAVLMTHYRGPGSPVYPSIRSIADRSGFGFRSVQRSLQYLADLGFVPRKRRMSRRGGWGWTYNLVPLWEALAVENDQRPERPEVTPDHRPQRPQVTNTTGHTDTDLRPERRRPEASGAAEEEVGKQKSKEEEVDRGISFPTDSEEGEKAKPEPCRHCNGERVVEEDGYDVACQCIAAPVGGK